MIDTRKDGLIMPDGTHMPPEAIESVLELKSAAAIMLEKGLPGDILELLDKAKQIIECIKEMRPGVLLPPMTPEEALAILNDSSLGKTIAGRLQTVAGLNPKDACSELPTSAQIEEAANSWAKAHRFSAQFITQDDITSARERGFAAGVDWVLDFINADKIAEDDDSNDMYCEGCCNYFSSSFQDNEAYCAKCGGTEIFKSRG